MPDLFPLAELVWAGHWSYIVEINETMSNSTKGETAYHTSESPTEMMVLNRVPVSGFEILYESIFSSEFTIYRVLCHISSEDNN